MNTGNYFKTKSLDIEANRFFFVHGEIYVFINNYVAAMSLLYTLANLHLTGFFHR